MLLTTRAARRGDGILISRSLRSADLQEVEALTREPPALALEMSIATSGRRAWVATDEHGPVFLWGVGYCHDPKIGSPWLVASERYKAHSVQFLRECRDYLALAAHGLSLLTNCTDARNTVHHRWLKWCGFEFIKLHSKWGAAQLPFWEFQKRISICASLPSASV